MVGNTSKKTLHRRNVFLSLTGVFIIIVIAVLFYIYRPTQLIVVDMDMEETLFSQKVAQGERFEVTYIHSVERSPVKEVFEVRGGNIYTMESHTESFGAGMPYTGEEMEVKDGKFIIKDINRKVHGGTLRIRPSSVFPHHIKIGKEDLVISDPPYKGRNLEIKVARTYFKR